MISSESSDPIRRVIEKLARQLSEESMVKQIDMPIDQVLDQFHFDWREPFTLEFFHQTVAEFVRLLYRHGLPLKRELSPGQARAEAVDLLKGYESPHGARGYEAALQDAAHGNDLNVTMILVQMAALVKAWQRQIHTHWVLASAQAAMDWSEKCRLTAYLLEAIAPNASSSMAGCPPAQFAGDWPDLLRFYFANEGIQSTLAAKTSFFFRTMQ